MPQITVHVNDRPYTMVCDEGEEDHLQELAQFLDKEVKNLKENFGQVGDSRLLMMAGLVVADKLSDALGRIEMLQEQASRLAGSEDRLAEKIEAAAGRIEALNAELNEAGSA